MSPWRNLRGLTVVACLCGAACADENVVGDRAAAPQSEGGEPTANRIGAARDDDPGVTPLSIPAYAAPQDASGPGSLLVIARDATIDACSFHAPEQDRVAFHHRDDASGTCVDVILVRVGRGGIAPEGFAMPWDWGVGHMSSYPCTPDGQIAAGASSTPLTPVSADIGMGGGLTGLPAGVFLRNLTLAEPESGMHPGTRYVFAAANALDVTPTCGAAEPWASQPLNVNAELPLVQLTGCTYIGALDRVTIRQRDEATSICSEIRLVQSFGEEGYGTVPPGLSLPEGWAVEDMYAFFCWPENASRPESPHYSNDFTDALGMVTFGGSNGALPQYVSLDVSLSAPDPETAAVVPEDLRISGQRLLSNDSIDLSKGCSPW